MKTTVVQSTLYSSSQWQFICQPLQRKHATFCLTHNLPMACRDSRGGKKKPQSISAPRTLGVTSPKLLREHDFPVHWALLYSLTIGDLPQQMHKTSFSSCLLSQRQVVYWEVYPSCCVTAMPVQSLPDFQSFFLISPALNFPVSSKKTQALFVSLFQTGSRKENLKAISCSMLLCWINNALNKMATIFLGNIPVN